MLPFGSNGRLLIQGSSTEEKFPIWWFGEGLHRHTFATNIWQVVGVAKEGWCLICDVDIADVKEGSFPCWDLTGSLQQGGFGCWWSFGGISLLPFPPSALLRISRTDMLGLAFLFLRSLALTSWKWNERISFSASKLPWRSPYCFVFRVFCKQSKASERTTDPSQSDLLSSVTIFVRADACFMSPFHSF